MLYNCLKLSVYVKTKITQLLYYYCNFSFKFKQNKQTNQKHPPPPLKFNKNRQRFKNSLVLNILLLSFNFKS